jgi:HKD family nuclease
MADTDDRPESPVPGLYDHLLSAALEHQIQQLADPETAVVGEVDPDDAHTAIAQYLEHLLAASLSNLRGRESSERRRRLVGRILEALAEELGPEWSGRLNLADPLRRLLAIHDGPDGQERPDTPLARSALLTGTRIDPSLASQLSKEIDAADRVDILCSFIKWSGLRLLLGALEQLTGTPSEDGPRLRVISTSYMGATDPKAIEVLRALPNTEVKVSYDTARTRLHAKAYVIHRATGFGSAYVGSANISKAALSEGLEWTSKISQYELPHLWQKIIATFETYWNDEEFEAYDEAAAPRLREAIRREREHAPRRRARGAGQAPAPRRCGNGHRQDDDRRLRLPELVRRRSPVAAVRRSPRGDPEAGARDLSSGAPGSELRRSAGRRVQPGADRTSLLLDPELQQS